MGNQQKGMSKSEVTALSESTKFNKEEIEELQKEFSAMDKDKSGMFLNFFTHSIAGELDKTEFKTLFKSRVKGINDDQLDKLFSAFDSDASGKITFKELVVALSLMSKGTGEDKLKVFTL